MGQKAFKQSRSCDRCAYIPVASLRPEGFFHIGVFPGETKVWRYCLSGAIFPIFLVMCFGMLALILERGR